MSAGKKLQEDKHTSTAEYQFFDSLRSADAFPVVASLPPKNSVCEPERLNDFRDVRTFVFLLTNQNAR